MSPSSFLQRSLDWLSKSSSAGDRIKRNLLLLLLLALLSLLPITITPAARFWAAGGALLLLLLTLLTLGGASWISGHLLQNSTKLPGGPLRIPQVARVSFLWQAITRLGLLFPAVVFFLFWTLLYIALWAWDPGLCAADPAVSCSSAFAGIEQEPIFGDFLYFAVNMAFANPVPDILASSRIAHTLATLEVVSGVALATFYAGTFFGLSRKTA